MKITKQTLKRLIQEELEDGALTAEAAAVDPAQLDERFDAALKAAIKELDETLAKSLVGKLISGHEDEGPVVRAYVYGPGYGDPVSIVAVFEDSAETVAEAFID